MISKVKYFRWTKQDFKELIPRNVKGMMSMFSSLSNRNFRLYFIGQIVSMTGTWVQSIAMSWLIYRLTGSIPLLTTIAFAYQIPSLILTPITGVLCDRLNKFNILVISQITYAIQATLLTVITLMGIVEPWHLIVLALVNGITASFEGPARQSFYTMLVSKDVMPNAVALNSVTINGSRIIGPTIGGILIVLVGEGFCFLINALSYIAVFAALAMMHLKPYKPSGERKNIITEFKEGFKYINGFLPLKAVLVFVAVISFFAMPIMTIIPALIKDVLGGDSVMLGYMNSAIGLGALVAALYLASRKQVKGLGKLPTITGIVIGLMIIVISFTREPVIACLCAFPLGFALIGSMATCNTLLQTMVDNDKRGRVMSFFVMCFWGMSPVGGMIYGFLSDYISLSSELLIMGSVSLVAGVVYEYYRPAVRAAARDRFTKGGVVKEIATAIDVEYNNPFD